MILFNSNIFESSAELNCQDQPGSSLDEDTVASQDMAKE